MKIILDVFCEDDLEIQCQDIIEKLHEGKSIKKIAEEFN